jgi:hypothetical protein
MKTLIYRYGANFAKSIVLSELSEYLAKFVVLRKLSEYPIAIAYFLKFRNTFNILCLVKSLSITIEDLSFEYANQITNVTDVYQVVQLTNCGEGSNIKSL